MQVPVSLLELITILGVMTLVAIVSHFIRLPTIVAFIVAGIAAGPFGLKLVSHAPDANLMAEIAAVFLMFTIGLEFSFKRLLSLKREFLKLGFSQVTLTLGALTLIAVVGFAVPLKKAIFFGCLVTLSSTALILKLLYERREIETPYGRNALGILLFQDLAVIPMMIALPFLATQSSPLGSTLAAPSPDWWLKVATLVGGVFLGGRFVLPLVMDKVAHIRSREVFFFAVLFICLGAAYLFHHLGLSLSLGAFVAGMVIAESPYGRQATSDILPLRDNFLGLLFATVGMMLDLDFLYQYSGSVLLMSFSLFVVKMAVTLVACLLVRTPVKLALITSLMVCQVGEFSFILASNGLSQGLLSPIEHQHFLSVSILSMLATPLMFFFAHRFSFSLPEQWNSLPIIKDIARTIESVNQRVLAKTSASPLTSPSAETVAGHALLIGFGIANQNLASAFSALGLPFKIIEANYESVKKFQTQNLPINFGDATSTEVLHHAGLEQARLVVIAVTGAPIVRAVVNAIRRLRPDIPIVVRIEYLRDASTIDRSGPMEVIVGEVEASVELLARSLKVFGVDSEVSYNFMTQTKNQLLTFAAIASELGGTHLNLPSWEALGAIRPLRITKDFGCINKALFELELPRSTGASVVAVYRQDLGTTIPGAEFVLLEGDVLHLVGSPQTLKDAESLLRGAPHA